MQDDHLHLIVEADDNDALARGMKSFSVRANRLFNAAAGRGRGRVWADRYHRRDLTNARQVRNALVYCLCNYKKHQRVASGAMRIDPARRRGGSTAGPRFANTMTGHAPRRERARCSYKACGRSTGSSIQAKHRAPRADEARTRLASLRSARSAVLAAAPNQRLSVLSERVCRRESENEDEYEPSGTGIHNESRDWEDEERSSPQLSLGQGSDANADGLAALHAAARSSARVERECLPNAAHRALSAPRTFETGGNGLSGGGRSVDVAQAIAPRRGATGGRPR